jgi:16S rRNA C967 or C1407 C5-methylase (RsmB/RsmF family)
MDPEENESIVKWALEEFGDILSIETIKLEGIERKKIVSSFKDEVFDSLITHNVLRVWPHHYDTNGFFVSVFRKTRKHREEGLNDQ